MNIDLRMHNVELVNAFRAYLEKRLRFGLGRHADHIRNLRLRLSGQDGATGGTATVCFLTAELVPSGNVVVTETSIDVYEALSCALERLKRTLRRKIEQQRSARRARESVGSPMLTLSSSGPHRPESKDG